MNTSPPLPKTGERFTAQKLKTLFFPLRVSAPLWFNAFVAARHRPTLRLDPVVLQKSFSPLAIVQKILSPLVCYKKYFPRLCYRFIFSPLCSYAIRTIIIQRSRTHHEAHPLIRYPLQSSSVAVGSAGISLVLHKSFSPLSLTRYAPRTTA
jgi:hypothetical protein